MRELSNRRVLVRAGVVITACMVVLAISNRGAEAQVTVETLIGQAVSDSNAEQYKDVGDALTHFQNSDINGTRELLQRAKKKNPKLPPSEVMMARLLLSAGQLAVARAELERAVATNPNDPEAYLIFAELALRDGRPTDAEGLYLKAKSLAENFKENAKRQRNFMIRADSGLAGVFEARGKWDLAQQYLKAWLELDPESAGAHERLGRAYFKQSNDKQNFDKEAYQEFQTAVKLDPQMMNPDIMMGNMYEDANNHEQAVKFIQAAVKKNSQDSKILLEAAMWAMITNRLNDAQNYAETAIKIDPKSVEAMVLRGEIARMTGDLKMAESLLEQAHLQAPSNLNASNQLAIALADQNDPNKRQRALELAQMNLRLSSQGNQVNPEVLMTLAWVLFRTGKGDEAEKLVTRILQSGGLNGDIAYYAARILQDRGHGDDAVKLLEVGLQSTSPFIQRQNAKELLKQLSEKKPETPPPAAK